jgi:glucose-6-phosphate dehydrogenase assembly protein OpcA
VFDTTACIARQLFDLERLATAAQPLPIADLGWLRLGALRAMFAGIFDPPVGGARWSTPARITIDHRAGCDAARCCCWRGSACCRLAAAARAQTPTAVVRFDFARAGQPVSGHLVPSTAAAAQRNPRDRAGETRGETLRHPAHGVDQAGCRRPACRRTGQARLASDAELAVAALGSRGRDPLFIALPELRATALVARDRNSRQRR